MNTDNKYWLKTGESGVTQLDGLDFLYGEESRRFLLDIGLKSGMQVADVGCGIGNLSCWMAEQVGSDGHVHAFDYNPQQLVVAAQRAEQRGLTNISFHEKSVHDLAEFNENFDLTYCRWLLTHVKEPAKAIKVMADTVREKGMLVCELGDIRGNRAYPELSSHQELFKLCQALLVRSGCDIDISYKAHGICKSLDGFTVDTKLSQRLLTDPNDIRAYIEIVAILLDSVADSVMEQNLLTKPELDKLKAQIASDEIAEDTIIYLSRMTQVCCRKG